MPSDLTFTTARADQLATLDQIRLSAFAPVFASFRSLLGDALYELAQARDDQAQGDLLVSLLQPDSGWEVYTVAEAGVVVGFVSLRMNPETFIGEIGLNAVDPKYAQRGIGTAMY